MLTLDVDERIKKFNTAAFDVLLNTSDLSEIVKCELIIKKCLLVLMYGIRAVEINQNAVHKLHTTYRKMFRYRPIFKLSKCAHLSELLDVFGIGLKSISELIRVKSINVTKQCMESRFSEIFHISLGKLYGL